MTDSQSKPLLSTSTYNVLHNDKIGRYMVASKDLEAGEEILSEMPFVVGPKASTYPLCLSCFSSWPQSPEQTLCSRCSWPVCNENCANASIHKDYECPIFAAVGEKFNVSAALEESNVTNVPQLECITPLRLLLAMEKFPERWEKEVKIMEAHNKNRSDKKQWKTDNVNIVGYLRDRLKLDRFSEETIQTACGILEINSHEVKTPMGFSARALYPTVAIMSHSCISNTSHSVCSNDFKVILRTTVKVPKGKELYGSYTHSLLPTLMRRENLLEGKHFSCACARCSDPTEMGTHLSSLNWKCTHCEFSTSGAAVKKVFDVINAEVEAAESYNALDGADAVHIRENIMKKYHSVLHPRHAFLSILRMSLSQLYGRVDEYNLDDLPDIVLEHKIDICKMLLQVLDVIEPGYTRARALTLYELHAPLLFIAKSQWNAGTIDDAALKSKMTEAASVLKDAVTILSLEPSVTIEGQLANSYSDKLGRYLIAAKKIAPGEVILRDNPIVVGAASFNDNSLCFSCFRVIEPKPIGLKFPCPKCKVAIFCSTNCETRESLHTPEECKLLKDKLSESVNQDVRGILLLIRLLLTKKRNAELWNRIINLEAHLEERRNTYVWKERQEEIEILKMFEFGENDEDLQRLCGIIDVNSFELRSPGSLDSALRGLYAEAALMAHDCRGNTHLTVDDDFQLTVYASQSINEGEPILFNYTSSLLRFYSGALIKTTLELTKIRIDQADESRIKELETLLKNFSVMLHSNHFLMMSLKQKLLALYRKEITCPNPKKKILQRMMELCKGILQVLEIVEPGISRLKGIILYEIHLPIIIIANKDYALREITSEDLAKRLEEAENYLKRSLSMLLIEPASTPEGVLAKRALQEYKALKQNLDDVRSLPPSLDYKKIDFEMMKKRKNKKIK
ncbi:Similar to SmydA-8: SET domain-containing protein SmydA-8 [Cotesia congregata]|uniref:Isoform A (Drosophila melanogaster) n=1 Tax=Cotesia congregata TaxID=51543 RepID=A0A8J2HGE2_COTCN|nr:Similar to SmydA-8: SET domain-containing protein SmydA-8 [Cotesia congregata]